MTFLNKNYFLSLTCALLISNTAIVPSIVDSPEVEALFDKEFFDALHSHTENQIIDVIKKYRTSLSALDTNAVLFMAQGYIFGLLTHKKQLLETGTTPSQHNDVLAQEVKSLEHTYANLKAMAKNSPIPSNEENVLDIFQKELSLPFYQELLNAINYLSPSHLANVERKYITHFPLDDSLHTSAQLALVYIEVLTKLEVQKSENTSDLPTSTECIRLSIMEHQIMSLLMTDFNEPCAKNYDEIS